MAEGERYKESTCCCQWQGNEKAGQIRNNGQMIAAVLTRPKTFELQEVQLPVINESELKIKVEGCGVCASSIPLWEGREWFSYPYEPGSPGHEGWGIVEETGNEVTGIKTGDRVAFLSYHAY